MEFTINYWAVLVAALANFVLGFLWYGPVFGKQWLSLTKMKVTDEDKKMMPRKSAVMFVASLLMAYVLFYFTAPAADLMEALQWAGWIWLGFIATVTLSGVLWKREPKALWVLDNGYRLVALLTMTAILYSWV